MRSKFDEQLHLLNQEMMQMGSMIEDSIQKAINALIDQNVELAKKIMDNDTQIDHEQKKIENLCFNLLMQQQPVAKDLRTISSALKMISDMERIGDQAYDIAEITKTIDDGAGGFCQDHISAMAQTAIQMVTESIDSFVKKDIGIAKNVIISDDKVDDLFIRVKNDLIDAVTADRSHGEYLFDILMIAKYLERISDHAVNIAEWVIFSVTGKHVSEQQEKETI